MQHFPFISMRLPVVQLKQWPQTSAANEVEGSSTFGGHNLRHVVASNHANPILHNPSEFHSSTRYEKNKWLKHLWGEVIHKGKSPSAIRIYSISADRITLVQIKCLDETNCCIIKNIQSCGEKKANTLVNNKIHWPKPTYLPQSGIKLNCSAKPLPLQEYRI